MTVSLEKMFKGFEQLVDLEQIFNVVLLSNHVCIKINDSEIDSPSLIQDIS